MAEKPLENFQTFAAPTAENHEATTQIERLDEHQILESLKGRSVDKLFHEFEVRGTKVVALSWAGVKYFALQLKNITVEEVKLTESDEAYRAIAWAKDLTRNVRIMGAAEQSRRMKLRDGSLVPDEFALAKVISKSQRNALRNLIPETIIAEAYQTWKKSTGR